jgi:hypothetical protein
MIKEHFDDLIGKLEDQARRSPSAYRFKVRLVAIPGNGQANHVGRYTPGYQLRP